MLSGGNAWADEKLGKGDDQKYCAFEASQTQSIKDCVVILAYYHTTDYSDGWTLSNIKQHVSINENYYSVQNGGRTAAEAYDTLMNLFDKQKSSLIDSYSLPNNSMNNAVAECNKLPSGSHDCIKGAGTSFTKKVGKNKVAICYTDYWDWDSFYGTCTGKITPGGHKEDDSDGDGDGDGDGGDGTLDTDVEGGDPANCSTLFPQSWCGENGITEIINFVVAVLTGTVVVAGTVGIIICAVLILTARDNEQQLATGKKRLVEVIVGMIAWLMLSVIVNLLFPKTTDKIDEQTNVGYVMDGGKKA